MNIIADSGTSFAFPAQTIHPASDGLDADRARAAEVEVGRWRAEGTLPMPEFPPDRVARLGGTLDYPPTGSVGHKPTSAGRG